MAAGAAFNCAINFSSELLAAAAATVDVGALDSNRIYITGPGTITSLGVEKNQYRIIRFDPGIVLTHSSSLILLAGASRTTVAGSSGTYVSDANGNWLELHYHPVDLAPSSLTGWVEFTLDPVAPTGWILADDGTIGDVGSGATTRANADTSALYTLIWNSIGDADAPVTGGRGVSAAADFAALKPIRLPLMRGRALGVKGAGAGLTSRSLGSSTGTETHTLTVPQTPPHSHQTDQTGVAADTTGLPVTVLSPYTVGGGTETNVVGGGLSHPNMQPTAFINAIIKL